jgi:hypothetical protein
MKTYALAAEGVLKHYNYLWRLSPDRWAWEYLRRNAEFLKDADRYYALANTVEKKACHNIRILKSLTPQTIAERWGLVMLPDPKASALDADLVWNHKLFPDQIEVNVTPRAKTESCDIFERTIAVCTVTHVTDTVGREYLILRGNGCALQVRCTGLSLLTMEHVRMKLQVPDFESYDRKIKAQQQGMLIFGNDPDAETPMWSKKTQILRDGLIALDCLALGMSRREIAITLYGKLRVETEWSDPSGSMKDAIKYVIKKAEGMRDGGYLIELLGAQLGPN